MRILQIEFENLNSLAGKWKINLTHPDFITDGIFAITGPTGAGKTTILDAICLALYGCTPRLQNVSKSTNEIMSRQTGKCFAEVVFETGKGRFRCNWGQHRAHKKATGDLQSAHHEIVNDITKHLIESTTTKVTKKVEEVTGLDFDRFTRSILLAQGGFAAFLQAKTNERSEILEQITGTEIYSKISLEVHRRKGDEQNRLNELKVKIDAVRPLSVEEEKQFTDELSEKTEQEKKLIDDISTINTAVTWLESIDELKKNKLLIDNKKIELQKQLDSFAPDKVKLTRALKALELEGEYSSLCVKREEQKKERLEHEKIITERPLQEEKLQKAQKDRTDSQTVLEKTKCEQDTLSKLLKEVRGLDLKISEKKGPIDSIVEKLDKQDKELKKQLQNQVNNQKTLETRKEEFSCVTETLRMTAADEQLVTDLTGIVSRLKELKELSEQCKSTERELEILQKTLTETKLQCDETKKALDTKKVKRDEFQLSFDSSSKKLEMLLDGREIKIMRESLDGLKDQVVSHEDCIKTLADIAKNNCIKSEQDHRVQELASVKDRLEKESKKIVEKKEQLSKEVNLLEQNLLLQKTIENYEDARKKHLTDGKECPLCGSLNHPWAEGVTPIADTTQIELNKRRQEFEACNTEYIRIEVEQNSIAKEIKQTNGKISECSEDSAKFEKEIEQYCIRYLIDSKHPDLQGEVNRLLEENKNNSSKIKTDIDAVETLEKVIKKAGTTLQIAKDAVTEAERAVQISGHNKEIAERDIKKQNEQLKTTESKLEHVTGVLRDEVVGYGIIEVTAAEADTIAKELTTRRNKWQELQIKKTEIDKEISILNHKLQLQLSTMEKINEDSNENNKSLDKLLAEQQKLHTERRNLFEDKNCDNEEARLRDTLQMAEAAFEDVRKQVDVVNEALIAINTQKKELENSIRKRGKVITDDERLFVVHLNDAGFKDEVDYSAACLSNERRQKLHNLSEEITKEQSILNDRERSNEERLNEELDKKITARSREELVDEKTTLLQRQKQLQQDIGAIKQKLTSNDQLKKEQCEQLKLIEKQEMECDRWNQLHNLIGSSDGKKFRNFAQGITFEMMVRHANHELRKMNDRYQLDRDKNAPLELNVKDNYQADEIRSTKNLSGGESFIVSLALALGLSKMASEKIRIDSLFLDEGFGTLDEEALETALSTLAGLKQNGKLIGVISHVQALKERIATQIEVTPRSGGRSVLNGPGCGRVVAA